MRAPRPGGAPLPLLAGFGLFVAALAYLVVASLTRRAAPVFAPTPPTHSRAAGWMRVGDTLTLDATDGEQWRFASLTLGRALPGGDSAGWELAARRYRITVAGALANLGPVPFETARVGPGARFVTSAPGEVANDAIRRWYRYSLVTHLLSANSDVYVLRTRAGRLWKLQVLGYYCPGLVAGCLTVRYAPLDAPAARTVVQPSRARRSESRHRPGAGWAPAVLFTHAVALRRGRRGATYVSSGRE